MKVTLVHNDRPATTDLQVDQVRIHLDDGTVLVLAPDLGSDDLHAYLSGQGERQLALRPASRSELRIGVES